MSELDTIRRLAAVVGASLDAEVAIALTVTREGDQFRLNFGSAGLGVEPPRELLVELLRYCADCLERGQEIGSFKPGGSN